VPDDSSWVWQQAADDLLRRLEVELPGRWSGFEYLPRVDSTNRWLLDAPALVPDRYHVCVAREQTAGHGRRGRSWISAPDASLTFSVARALRPNELPSPALSLAVGVGVARGLGRCGFSGFGFKWPNDLVTADGAKLAGILAEARPALEDRRAALVVGVGLNRTGAETLGVRDRRVADLTDLAGSADVPLPDLLAALLAEIVQAWEGFAQRGLEPIIDDYSRLDHLRGRRVRVIGTGDQGTAAGIDPADGALLLQQVSGLKRLYSGDVSVRVSDDG
jgi:BirA family transcriptional regulator, biotin operon repressor / biotin---[acetyl-CoA-carboxylase] ligase